MFLIWLLPFHASFFWLCKSIPSFLGNVPLNHSGWSPSTVRASLPRKYFFFFSNLRHSCQSNILGKLGRGSMVYADVSWITWQQPGWTWVLQSPLNLRAHWESMKGGFVQWGIFKAHTHVHTHTHTHAHTLPKHISILIHGEFQSYNRIEKYFPPS